MNLALAILLAGSAGMGVPAAGGGDVVVWLPPIQSDQGLRWGSQAGRLRSAPSPGLADRAVKRRRKAQRAARREQRRRR